MIPGGQGKYKRSELLGTMKGFSSEFPILNMSMGGVAFETEEKFKLSEELIFQLLVPEDPPLNHFSQIRRQTGFGKSTFRTTGIEFMPFGNDQSFNSLEKLETLNGLDARYGNIMQPHITFKSELGFVHVIAKGDLNNKIFLNIVKRASKIAEEHQCKKVLCDFTDMTITESTIGIYNYPLLAKSNDIPTYIKCAVLYLSDDENFRFLETVCRNEGYYISIFKDNTAATEWLADS